MKNFKEMAEELLTGEVLVDSENREYILDEDGDIAVMRDNEVYKYVVFLDFCKVQIKSKYADIKIDDPVYVWMGDCCKKSKRHFAGVDEERNPLCWLEGQTSWTTSFKSAWDHCEPATNNFER